MIFGFDRIASAGSTFLTSVPKGMMLQSSKGFISLCLPGVYTRPLRLLLSYTTTTVSAAARPRSSQFASSFGKNGRRSSSKSPRSEDFRAWPSLSDLFQPQPSPKKEGFLLLYEANFLTISIFSFRFPETQACSSN